MKRILVDAYLEVNLGDDLFIKILSDRYPKHLFEIRVNDYDNYKELFHNYKNIIVKKRSIFNKLGYRYKSLSRLLSKKDSMKYDAYIIIGGSIFIEGENWGKKYNERKNKIISFNKKTKPTFVMGCNFGPYVSEDFKDKYYNLFAECKDVCFRDTKSYSIFEGLKNIRVESDIVFQLKYNKQVKIPNTIGVSLINLTNRNLLIDKEKEYIKKIIEVISYLTKQGKKIILLSFCEKEGDVEIINKIMESVPKGIEVCNYNKNIDEYIQRISRLENIIGIRFHSIILSQVFNQGVYPIIYSEKTINTLNDIKLNKCSANISTINDLKVINIIKDMEENKIDLDELKNIISSSKRQFSELDKFLLRNIR